MKQSSRFKKNIQNAYVSFDIVTLAIYSNNNGNMVVGEIPEFFHFPKRDISTARCKRTIYIFIYKGMNVVMITGFINMPVFFLSKAEFNFFLKEIFLVMRNDCITISEIEVVLRLCIQCSYIKIVLDSNFNQYLLNKKDDTCPLLDTN